MTDINAASTDDKVKMVPESDLISIKKILSDKYDNAVTEWTSKLNAAAQTADEHYQNLLKEKSSNEELAKKIKELEGVSTKLQETQGLLETANKSLETMKSDHVSLKKKYLKDLYALSDDKLEGKTIEDLNTLEIGLVAAGVKPRFQGYDMGGGAGGSGGKSAIQECMDEIAEAKSRTPKS